MGDYCDAMKYKESILFQEHPCALQIQLFYDELEVCNPLGSKAKKHKLGKPLPVYTCLVNLLACMSCNKNFFHVLLTLTIITYSNKNFIGLVYYNLGNLNPKLRSSLKSIHLLCIARYQLITKYGIDEIFAPIVEAIRILESVSCVVCIHIQ